MDSIVFSVPIPSKGKERDKTMPSQVNNNHHRHRE